MVETDQLFQIMRRAIASVGIAASLGLVTHRNGRPRHVGAPPSRSLAQLVTFIRVESSSFVQPPSPQQNRRATFNCRSKETFFV
jgi:hypothetical protein